MKIEDPVELRGEARAEAKPIRALRNFIGGKFMDGSRAFDISDPAARMHAVAYEADQQIVEAASLTCLPRTRLGRPHHARSFTRPKKPQRAIGAGGLFERMWQFLCFGDVEWSAQQ